MFSSKTPKFYVRLNLALLPSGGGPEGRCPGLEPLCGTSLLVPGPRTREPTLYGFGVYLRTCLITRLGAMSGILSDKAP